MNACPGLDCPAALEGDLCCLSCSANERMADFEPLTLELPWPPSVNRYWRHVSFGRNGVRVLLSADGRAYQRDVTSCVLSQFAARRQKLQTIEGPVSVGIELCPPDRRIRDLDNSLKACLDALTHAHVWRDDSQVERICLNRGSIISGGKAVVQIRRLA